MDVYIDADACPVTRIAAEVCRSLSIPCTLLCDTAHSFSLPGVETVTVDTGADSVDFALLKRLRPGDVVVTQDYGLAALCLARSCHPIHQDGWAYTDDNIQSLLTYRQAAAKIQRSGGTLKGAKKRTAAQDTVFAEGFRQLLQTILQG